MKEKYDGKRKNLLRNNEVNYSGTMVRDVELWSKVVIPRIAPFILLFTNASGMLQLENRGSYFQ
jgi:hypothetical protein